MAVLMHFGRFLDIKLILWINQVSLKNIDIWPSWPAKYQSLHIMGIHFFGHYSVIFLSNHGELFYGTQETFIYWSAMRNHNVDAFWKKKYFLVGKMGVAATVAPKSPGPQDPTEKVGPLGGPFESTIISKTCFQKFRAWLPPPPT